MRRWHAPRERAIMLRRRREGADGEQGIGFLRKRKPYDCGRPRCGLCHGEKFYAAKGRASKKRKAIEFELLVS